MQQKTQDKLILEVRNVDKLCDIVWLVSRFFHIEGLIEDIASVSSRHRYHPFNVIFLSVTVQ